jgi:uncharacterized protein
LDVARAGGIQKLVFGILSGYYTDSMGLIIRSSDIHAAGCYTTAPIKKGALVVQYTGPLITKDEGDQRYEGREYTYLFGMDDGRVIDGHGMAAFINHSCDPNCETDEIDGKLWIIALRDIKAGEELSYDYCLWDGEEDDPAPCHCGAKSCRGTMYSEEELERLEKMKKESREKVPA